MIRFQTGMMLRLIMIASLTAMFGCAQQMKSVQVQAPQEISANGEIREITLSDDAGRIDISSDRPIVYTYYLQDSPPAIVVDLAQVTTGNLQFPMEVNKGGVRRIEATRHEFGSGVLSRIVISLNNRLDVNASLDAKDNRHLVVNLTGASSGSPADVIQGVKPALSQTSGGSVEVAAEKSVSTVQAQQQPVPTPTEKTVAETPPALEKKPDVAAVANVQATEEKSQQGKAASLLAAGKKDAPNGERALKEIVRSTEGVNLVFSAEVGEYKSFKLTSPERLVIDISKAKNEIASKSVEINAFNLGKARIGGTPEKLRIVFDAAGGPIPPYLLARSEKGLLLSFGDAARAALAAKTAEKSAATASENVQPSATKTVDSKAVEGGAAVAVAKPSPEMAPVGAAKGRKETVGARSSGRGGAVDFIEFKQSEGVSTITVTTSGDCAASEPVKTAKGAYVSLKGCRLPAKLQRQLDTKGFTSVITEIVPYPVKTKGVPEARIAVKLRQSAANFVKRDNGVISWSFREPAKPEKISKPEKTVRQEVSEQRTAATSVKTDSMEREFVDVKPVQKPFSERAGGELTLDKSAQQPAKPGKHYTGRKVSLEFSDADIRKIFQLIAEVSNQNFLISDDVSGTISLKLVNVPWDQALDVILENKGLGMQKDGNIVQIRPKAKMKSLDDENEEIRKAEERRAEVKTEIFDINFATISDIAGQFEKLKSSNPKASVNRDERTNKIIVNDLSPNLKKMRALLESLDVPEKQVMIEARIVEASSNFARDIGIKWNFGYQDASASIANINNLTTSMGGVVTNVLPTGTTGGIAAGMSFGKLISNIQLDMRLSAASTVGQVKIISTPKVLTVNNKPAKISQGQMIPYQNTSSAEGAKTDFIEAALSLEVTPHITADGSVNMKIKASNNSVGTGSPPPINKKEATTELMVKNGETTVIGGIYVDSETEGDTGVPYLSDIPLLGWLFKSNAKNKTKNELLIFITPKIMI